MVVRHVIVPFLSYTSDLAIGSTCLNVKVQPYNKGIYM